MDKIALFGAAGAVGKSIAGELRSRGIAYRVVGRDRRRLASTFASAPLAEIVTWNPDDPASVRSAAEGVDTLIYLLGVPYNRFELHPIIMQQTLDGAIAGGVKRIILIGTVYPYGMPVTPTVAETHPRNPTTFKGRIKSQSRTGRLQLCSCICRRQRSHLTDSAANAIRRQMPCNQEQP